MTGSLVLASHHTFLVAGLLVPYDGDGILLNEVSPMRGRALPGFGTQGDDSVLLQELISCSK